MSWRTFRPERRLYDRRLGAVGNIDDADAPIFRVQHIQIAPAGTGRERHVEQIGFGNRVACPMNVLVTRFARES